MVLSLMIVYVRSDEAAAHESLAGATIELGELTIDPCLGLSIELRYHFFPEPWTIGVLWREVILARARVADDLHHFWDVHVQYELIHAL